MCQDNKTTNINRARRSIFIDTGAHCALVGLQIDPNRLLITSGDLISKKQNQMFGVILILGFTACLFVVVFLPQSSVESVLGPNHSFQM